MNQPLVIDAASKLHPLVEGAMRELQAGKLADALTAWETVRLAFPESPLGYSGSGEVLRRLNRIAEAETVLTEGLAKFPMDPKVNIEHAWIAHHRADWAEANIRWKRVRENFPDMFAGYFGGGATLRSLRLFDEAQRLYDEALGRWPDASNLLADYAALAQAQGHFSEASQRWATLLSRFPGDSDLYLRRARALCSEGLYGEAEEVLEDALARCPQVPAISIEYAHIAQRRGNTLIALKRWEAVVTSFHGLVDGYVGAAHTLNDLGRYSDAQNVLQPALRMFPHSESVAVLNAWIAHYRTDFSVAEIRWAEIRSRYPSQPSGFIGGAVSTLAQGKLREASHLLEQGLQTFPNNMHIAMEFARLPMHTQNWDEAVARWSAIHKQFPSVSQIEIGYGQALMKAGKADEAETLLEHANRRERNNISLRKSWAECATQVRDWARAELRWQSIIDEFPSVSVGWAGLAGMLRNAGRFDESSEVLKAAVIRFEGNVDLEIQLALIATLQRRWPVALQMWEKLKRDYPRHPEVVNGITQALWQARQDQGVAQDDGEDCNFEIPASLMHQADLAGEDSADMRELLMGFESIGDTCEFGIVQRRFGAEPISLLRWASTRPAALIAALDSKFAGVGDPEYTIVSVIHGEYTTRDSRYHMFTHTFTPETAEALDKFTKQHLRRMQYLRQKLIGDLAAGEKIFVYKCNHGLSDEEASAIYDAIVRYGGKVNLLCVRIEDPDHQCGEIQHIRQGLFVGYIDRFSTVDINVEAWVGLCKKTAAITGRAHLRP